MNSTIFEKMKKTFQKIAWIKKAIEGGMTLEQAIKAYKKMN
jgi:exonuclease VII small subunit